ncbi:MAG: malto-oligosyltrehalose trehalohydrolase [Dehalococcoidia bacterium]
MMSATYRPSLGAWLDEDGVRFRVWATNASSVAVRIEAPRSHAGDHPIEAEGDGFFTGRVAGIGADARYRYVLDGESAFPDPASRFQPDGVHGASAVVDPSAFEWHDEEWRGLAPEDVIRYELHVGTLTLEGTYASTAAALEALVDLGVTAVQLMPLADFAGDRGWGYDGVAPMAPARCYGTPDEVRALVDRAHELGLAVILDVVYNHLGPDGAYQGAFSRQYYNEAHHTPWGAAINLDGAGSKAVRDYFVEIALHWLHEYHIDGFRLDATNQLIDDGPVHFLEEWARRIHEGARPGVRPLLIAEDSRNLATIIRDPEAGGYGFDEVLADDFHHELRRLLAGDHEGYYRDYQGTSAEVARALTEGWTYTGQPSPYLGRARGTDPTGVPLPRFGHCIQNHDQVGNRAFGERLHHEVSLEAYRTASALLLTSAMTPMLFMGQEWAASTPFLFFSDHHDELGRLVTAGRRREFEAWSAFADPAVRETIPDPQALETFARSHLRWDERDLEPHASTLRFYGALIALRRAEPALRWNTEAHQHAVAPNEDAVALIRRNSANAFATVACLRGASTVEVDLDAESGIEAGRWEVALTSEDAPFAPEPRAPRVTLEAGRARLEFERPGAVLLRTTER